jgi:hypothetical protein
MRFILIAAFLLAACGNSVTAPAASLLVTPIVTPQQIHAGDTVTVQVVVTNTGDRPQEYSENWCGGPFVIYASDGIVDPRANMGCFNGSLISVVTLGVGEQHVYTSQWVTNYAEAAFGTRPSPLAAGTYLIRGALQGNGVENVAVTVEITQ